MPSGSTDLLPCTGTHGDRAQTAWVLHSKALSTRENLCLSAWGVKSQGRTWAGLGQGPSPKEEREVIVRQKEGDGGMLGYSCYTQGPHSPEPITPFRRTPGQVGSGGCPWHDLQACSLKPGPSRAHLYVPRA